MTTRHLDIGCGACSRNPSHCDEAHAVDLTLPKAMAARLIALQLRN